MTQYRMNYPSMRRDFADAMQYELTPEAYQYNGQLEYLQQQISKLQEMLIKVASVLTDNQKRAILSNWEVENER